MAKHTNSIIALMAALTCSQAQAQAVEVEQASGSMVLEEVVVTAQKREENLQDVPVAISVVSGQQLVELGIEDFTQMADYIPSLTVTNAASITVINIRGISTGDNRGFEQSVGLFIDGVHQPRQRMYRATSFLDLENVQVLRGPQGYLFGKNTTGGALMLTSARPTDEFEGRLVGGYTFDSGYQNGGYNIEGYLSGGLTDTLSARLALRYIDNDGYFTNVLDTGNLDAGTEEQYAARLSFEWQPSDTFSALLKLETGQSKIDGEPNRTYNYANSGYSLVSLGAFFITDAIREVGASPLVEGSYVQSWSPFTFDDTNSDAATLTLDWGIGDSSLLSITGYTEYDYTQKRDGDLTNADIFNQDDMEDFSAISQELRWVSPTGGKLDYVAGVYYQSQDLDAFETRNINLGQMNNLVIDTNSARFFPPSFGGPLSLDQYRAILNNPANPLYPVALAVRAAVAPGGVLVADTATTRNFSADSETFSIYGNFNFNLSDKWTVTLGGNYIHESKDAERYLTIAGAVPVANAIGEFAHEIDGSRSVDKLFGTGKVQWFPSDEFMFYGSISQGFKSGGFDEVGTQGDDPGEYPASAGPADFEFDDENLIAYELGGKGLYMDGQLAANWAVFYQDLKDRQFSVYVPVEGFIVGNSGKVNYRGVELDGQWLATDWFLWELSIAYLRGEVKEPIEAGNVPVEERGRTGQPEWRVTNHWRYDWSFGNGLGLITDMYNIYDEGDDFGLTSPVQRDATIRTNLRFGLGHEDGAWEVAFIANNITDEELVIFPQVNAIFPNSAAGLNTTAAGFMYPPRSYTLQFSYNF